MYPHRLDLLPVPVPDGDLGGLNDLGNLRWDFFPLHSSEAACLYAAAEERCHPLTQQQAADVADVTSVTLRATCVEPRE